MEIKDLRFINATNETGDKHDLLKSISYTETLDEERYYKDLSKKLFELETKIEYNVDQVQVICEQVEKMFLRLDEKAELLMRCVWLVAMSEVKNEMHKIASLEDIKLARTKLNRVQTCPLKKQLIDQLAQIEAKLEPIEVVLTSKDALVEAILETGNKTFINLGTTGREYVLTEICKVIPSVELAISKAEVLETQVQAAKESTTVKELKAKLEVLPLKHLVKVPAEYEQEVLQKLLDQSTWNGLFNLDLLIRQFTAQIEKIYKPVQEGVLQSLVLDEKVIEQLGLQIQ